MLKIKFQYRDQFWEWCQKNNIICEYMGTAPISDPTDIWYIGNTKDRTLAILRWA